MLNIEVSEKQSLSRTFLEAVQTYYSNPLNVKKFEEWFNDTHKKEVEKTNG